MTTIDRMGLLKTLDRAFNEGEARDFVFGLDGDWDNLPGYTKRDKLRELILRYERQGQVDALIGAARAEGLFTATPVYQKSAADRAEDQQRVSPERRNELILLNKARGAWIEGVLEQSLYGVARIALGLERRPGEVVNPWQMTLQRDGATQTLPAGTRMIDVFDSLQGSVLILGEPGAGKTTMLLELARDLIERAEVDEKHWLPVVFNLSSWAEKRGKLTAWLVEELNRRYDAPRKTGQAWVEAERILPLLDGLDEVKEEERGACLAAINDFREEHGLVPMAVCSRVEEYGALGEKLRLGGAVLIQPLREEQVEGYLAAAGAPLAGLREAVAEDEDLRALAQTPLMLSVMSLAYQGRTAEEIVAGEDAAEEAGDEETRRRGRERQIFGRYVETMFRRVARTPNELYPRERAECWLAWLAGSMVRQGQTTFYVEGLQPDWLGSEGSIRGYRILVGLVFGLLGVLIGGLSGGLSDGWNGALFFSLLFGLVLGLFLSRRGGQIEMVETMNWSVSVFKKELRTSLPYALVGSLGMGLVGWVIGGLSGLLGGFLIGGLIVGLGGGLVSGLVGGQLEKRMEPNQGIRRSLQSACIGGLVGGLVAGLGGGLIGRAIGEPSLMKLGVLVMGLWGALVGGLIYGGRAVIRHYTLRFVLWWRSAMPWDYVRFLEYAKERILLRRVGGGYIFVHRLLMEYFASLNGDPHPGPLPQGEGD